MASTAKRSGMTDAHKAALAVGRAQGLAVRKYLEALERGRPRRGRRPSEQSLRQQLEEVEAGLREADPLKRLHLIQQRKSLQTRLVSNGAADDISELEAGFVAAAGQYAARKGIDYATWREAGVPAEVLARAGVHKKTG